MRSVLCAISRQTLASGYGPGDRVAEALGGPGVTLHVLTGASDPPGYRENVAPGFRQQDARPLSDDGTGPAVAFWGRETGREVSGALRAEERAVIEGGSLSLVHA